VAHPSGGPDADRHIRPRPHPASRRGNVEEIRQGDIVWFPAREKHWNGASPETAMSHIAIQESIDGSPVTWMEKVSDKEYWG